jgi:hypothetical protein
MIDGRKYISNGMEKPKPKNGKKMKCAGKIIALSPF